MDFPPSDIPNDASRSNALTNGSLQVGESDVRANSTANTLRRCKIITTVVLVLVTALACLIQFSTDSLSPLVIATLLSVLLCVFWPSRKRLCLALPVITLVLLRVDAIVLRHSFAIGFRNWDPLWGPDNRADVLLSPSGHSTAYLISTGWLDCAHWVYISDGCLFPKKSGVISVNNNTLTLQWNEGVLTAVEYPEQNGEINRAAKKVMVFRYTESTGILEDDKEQLRFENSEPDTKGGQSRDGEQ